MMISSKTLLGALCLILAGFPSVTDAFSFVARKSSMIPSASSRVNGVAVLPRSSRTSSSSSLKMIDDTIIQGAGIAIAGLALGIGLVAFTEQQGERAKERGGGLSERMSTQIVGGLMEDVEVSSVSDLSSLTSQLENALRETGTMGNVNLEMSEEEKKRIKEEADDGW